MQNDSTIAPAVNTKHWHVCFCASSYLQYSDFCTENAFARFFATKLQGPNSLNRFLRSTIPKIKPNFGPFCNANPAAKPLSRFASSARPH